MKISTPKNARQEEGQRGQGRDVKENETFVRLSQIDKRQENHKGGEKYVPDAPQQKSLLKNLDQGMACHNSISPTNICQNCTHRISYCMGCRLRPGIHHLTNISNLESLDLQFYVVLGLWMGKKEKKMDEAKVLRNSWFRKSLAGFWTA